MQLDQLEPEILGLLDACGNTTANSVLEAALHDTPKLNADAGGAERQAWMHRKYVTKELCGHVPGSYGGGGAGGGAGGSAAGGGTAGGLAIGWEEVLDADGTPYYYHVETGVTQWERPGNDDEIDAESAGADALCAAAAAGDFPTLLWQLWQVGVPIDAPTQATGGTALHAAALGGHVHLAELLLQNGANADAVDDYGSSPLIAAAAAGVTVMPTGLLRRACFDDKMAALDLAVQAGNAALEETLRSVLGRQERTITGVDADASSVPSERISFVEQKAP